jgi:D-alanyl-D-alanine carboxypeptidase
MALARDHVVGRETKRMRAGALVAGALAGLALLGGGSAQADELPAADRQFVDATVMQAMQSGRLPGVSLKITGPRGDYVKTYGVSNRATSEPMALDDHVRIASITKSFTATAVLRQVQRGRLKLSDKLDRWVKGIRYGKRITVRQMLAMRSGVYDFTSNARFARRFEANPLLRWKPADVVRIIRANRPEFRPNAKTEYADSNYVLLGIILQKVTGRSAESVITRDVIDRAGLSETSFPTRARMPTPFSRGYFAGDDGTGPIRNFTLVNPKVAWTAGGMVSTLGDIEKWGRVLARGTLLSPRLQRARLRFGRFPNPGPFAGYGLGILRFGDWIGHDGAIFGFSTVTMYERTSGAQIVAAANLSSNFSTPTLEIMGLIAQHLYPESLEPD